MEGFDVVTVEDAIETADIVITATGNKDIITLDHMKAMKDKAILATSATSTTRSTWRP